MFRLLALLALLLACPATAGEVVTRQESGVWTTRDPSGVVVPTSAQCGGLQDAITYAQVNGHDYRLIGGQATAAGVDAAVIICDQTILFPPMQAAHIVFQRVTVHWNASFAGDGFVFDSCMMCDIKFSGQLVHFGGGRPLLFNPRSLLPIDNFVGPTITDSRFFFLTVARLSGGNGTAIEFAGTSIVGNDFAFIEVNAETSYGIHNLASTFVDNSVTARHVHGTTGMGVMNQTVGSVGNTWDIGVVGAAEGFYHAGDNDEIRLSAIDLTGPALTLANGACDNIILRRRWDGPLVNNSGCTSNRFY